MAVPIIGFVKWRLRFLGLIDFMHEILAMGYSLKPGRLRYSFAQQGPFVLSKILSLKMEAFRVEM